MNWPLFIIYFWVFIDIVITAAMHGEYKDEKFQKWNIFHKVGDVIIFLVMIWWLLGWRIW